MGLTCTFITRLEGGRPLHNKAPVHLAITLQKQEPRGHTNKKWSTNV